MECKEAQHLISEYIADTLPQKKMMDFINHVKTCSSCYDELETYFTIHFAIKSLDEDHHASYDFKNMLIEDLLKKEKQYKNNKLQKFCIIASSSVLVILILVLVYFIVLQRQAAIIEILWEIIRNFIN